MLRRNLFRAIAASAAASLRGQPAAAAASKLVTRRIDEMTSREVELYLKEGGDLVLVPFGPVSGHGAFIPMGMHAHWAQRAQPAARRESQWPRLSRHVRLLRRRHAHVSGDRLVSHPGAGFGSEENREYPCTRPDSSARCWWPGQTRKTPAGSSPRGPSSMRPKRPIGTCKVRASSTAPEIRAMYEGYPGNFGETLVELASLRILGTRASHSAGDWAKEIKH